MKLIRFGDKGKEKPGILVDGIRRDCSNHWRDWNNAFFASGGLDELSAKLNEDPVLFKPVPDDTRWGPPVARPGSIICIGLNYSDHARESGMAIPGEPILFMKATNTLGGPFDDVEIPEGSQKTDWEVELGIVVNAIVYRLDSEAQGEAAIAGYTIVHDVSEREYQLERGGQWVKGKSCPGFSPIGPYLLTRDEVPDPLQLSMRLSVNGQVRQDGHTSTMIFGPGYLVWYISQFMRLEAGDIISTGTPPGVGLAMQPPTYLRRGDIVELEIEHLGKQRQKFV